MAALTVSDNLWPFVDSFVLGNGVVSQVILPGVPYTMRVSLRPRTTAGKFVGANKAPAVLTVYGPAPTTDAGTYKILRAPTPAGTVASHTHTAGAITVTDAGHAHT